VVLVLGASFPLALFFAHSARTTWARALSLSLSVLLLATIFLVDYQLGWVALLTASAVWLGFVFWKNETVGFQWTILPAVALLLVVVGWPVVTTQLTRRSIPVEINLSLPASWKIANQNAKTNPLVGTGPETFIFGFSKYKPDQFNQSDFWAYRFDKSASELSQVFGTMGILGLASYLGVILLGLYLAWRAISHRGHEDWYLRAAVVAGYLVLVVGSVLYFSNTVLAAMFWLILGLLAGFSSSGEREMKLVSSPRTSFLFSFGLAIVVLVAVGAWVGIVRFWSADFAYAQAQSATTLSAAQSELTTAVALNPWRDTYRVGLAQVYLGLANQQAKLPAADTEAKRKDQLAQLQQYISSAIAAARSATDLSRENVFNWESLGSIYRGTVPYAKDAQEWVIKSFQEAIKLEYSNPALHTELGKAYLLSASQQKSQASTTTDQTAKAKLEADAASNLGLAIEQFKVAVQLKPQYTPAHFNQALAFELQGKIDDAIAKLESVRSYNPTDVDVLYELGSLYYSKANYDLALSAFSAITNLVPNHSNAHYGLSLVYQKKGDSAKAIAEMEKVLELNPSNQQVQQQLNTLKSGAAPAPAPTTK
jgi:tetratricopeptide (TPR) repeat protein